VCTVRPYHNGLRFGYIWPRAASLVPEAALDSSCGRKQAVDYPLDEGVFQSPKRCEGRGSHVDQLRNLLVMRFGHVTASGVQLLSSHSVGIRFSAHTSYYLTNFEPKLVAGRSTSQLTYRSTVTRSLQVLDVNLE
jgi:hypothetical protein